MKADIITLAKQTIREAVVYANEFDKYAYIWNSDKKQCLEQFLKYGRTLSSEEMEALGADTLEVCIFVFQNKLSYMINYCILKLKEIPATLDMFKVEIDKYGALYEEVSKIDSYRVFAEWLCIDLNGFKQIKI